MKKFLSLIVILIAFHFVGLISYADIKPTYDSLFDFTIIYPPEKVTAYSQNIDLTDPDIQELITSGQLKFQFNWIGFNPGSALVRAYDQNNIKIAEWSCGTTFWDSLEEEYFNSQYTYLKVPENTKRLYISLVANSGYFTDVIFDIFDGVGPVLEDIYVYDRWERPWYDFRKDQYFPNREYEYIGTNVQLKIKLKFNEEVRGYPGAKLRLNVEDKDGLPVYANLYQDYAYSRGSTFIYTPKPGDKIIEGVYNSIKYSDDRIYPLELIGTIVDYDWNNPWYNRLYDSDLPLTNLTKSSMYKGTKDGEDWLLRPIRLDITKPTATIEYYDTSVDTATTFKKRYENITIKNTDTQSPTINYRYQWFNDKNIRISEADITGTSNGSEFIDAPEGNSIYKLRLWVYDMACNEAYTEALFNQKDMEPPVIGFDYAGTTKTEYKKSHILNVEVQDYKIGLSESNPIIYYKWTNTSDPDQVFISDCNQAAVSPLSNYVLDPSGDGDDIGISTPQGVTGTYYLHIIALDAYGNKAHEVSEGFLLDNSGPKVTFEGDITLDNKAIPVKITVNDAHFGVVDEESLFYQVIRSDYNPNDYPEDWESFENGATVYVDEKLTGTYNLCIKGKDALGNSTDYMKHIIYFDYDPPTVNFSYNRFWAFKDYYNDLEAYVDIFDRPNYHNGGVDHGKFYYQWSKETVPKEELWRPLIGNGRRTVMIDSEMEGEYHLHVKVSDLLGNAAIYYDNLAQKVDNKPPSITISSNGGDGIYKKDIVTNVRVTDRTYMYMYYGWSKSKEVEPEWEQFGTWTRDYQGSLTMDDSYESGVWYLWIKARDTLPTYGAYNQRIFISEPFYLDNTQPTGSIGFTKEYTNKLSNELQLTVDDSSSTKMSFSNDGINWSPWEIFKPLRDLEIDSLEEGSHTVYVKFMDSLENISQVYEAQIIMDTTLPTGTVNYSEEVLTSNDVIANLIPVDDSVVSVLNNGGSTEYIFKKNGSFEFIFSDMAGNIGRAVAEVNNIDKNPPKGFLSYSHSLTEWTNEPITCTISLTDDGSGAVITSEGGNSYTFYDSGEFTFEFEDSLGNRDTVIASVYNIDAVPPKGTIAYSSTDESSAPVTAYLQTNEAVTITNNDGHNRKIFYENGEFKFTFVDKAGKTGEATAVVDNISSELPNFDVLYSMQGWTNDDVTVTYSVYHDDTLQIVAPIVGKEYIHTFNDNDSFDVKALYTEGTNEGVEGTVSGMVYNIDRKPPTAYVHYSTTGWTNNTPIIATILPIDDKSCSIEILNNDGNPVYSFYENGEFQFRIKDEAGNIATKTVRVDNIISGVPIPRLEYSTKEPTSEPVVVTLYFETDYPVEILNNNGDNTFTFIANGEFTFNYSYGEGFEGTVTTMVDNITSSVREADIMYYFEDRETPLTEGELSAPTNKNIIARISLKDTDISCRVLNNDGKDSYLFEENGYLEFIYEDESGQRGRIAAAVDNIDKVSPKATISYSNNNLTNLLVRVTLSFSKPVDIIEKSLGSVGSYYETKDESGKVVEVTYLMYDNGLCNFKVKDIAGNISEITPEVTNIDKDKPIGTVVLSNTSPTNQDVIATLTANEPITVTNNNGSPYFTFSNNGSFTFNFRDMAGNINSCTATVSNIDKQPPIVNIEYLNYWLTNQPVEATVLADKEIIVRNNNGKIKKTFSQNGYFNFDIVDLAGNEAKVKAEVTNIDTIPPQILLNGLSNMVLTTEDTYEELGARAADNRDGDLTNDIIIDNGIIASEAGTYVVSYRVTDTAGNSTTIDRTVKVISLDSLAIFINGNLIDGGVVSSSSSKISLSFFGIEGNVSVKWSEGLKDIGFFKLNGNSIGDNEWINALAPGWYTIYLQDQERNSKLIYVYYTGMDR